MSGKRGVIRIAILDHSPDMGGAEASMLTLLKKIDRSLFQVTVILPSRGTFSEELEKIDIAVNTVDLPAPLTRLKRGRTFRSLVLILFYFFSLHYFLMKLCFCLRKKRFDLIVTNTVKAHLYGSLAARLSSIPLLWRFHDILTPSDFSPLWIKCVTVFGNLFPRRVLAVSKITRDCLVGTGVRSEKVDVIFNGIDQERLEVEDGSKDIRAELGLQLGTRLVGCLGRIIPQKGQKAFLLAIPEVIKRFPETFFLIVGDVFLQEERYKEELLGVIKKAGIGKHVRFTGFRSDMGKVIRSLDIVVFPSVSPESFGLSVLESMSLGKPVIASEIGGVSELIEDGRTGMLIEPDHPEQIADRILFLFRNKEISDRIGQEAKEAVKKGFSLSPYVTAMEAAFKEAVSRE